VVQDRVRVALVTSGKYDHLKVPVGLNKDLLGVGSDVNSGLYYFSCWEGYRQNYVGVACCYVISTVDECFVKIEYYCLFANLLWNSGEVYPFCSNLCRIGLRHGSHELQSLECLEEMLAIDHVRAHSNFIR
jgi:hypothetical protein